MKTNSTTPIALLHRHNLKRTSCREGILGVMMSSEEALSEQEIRDRLAGHYDRTTFYRSFKTLEEHGLIHRIVVADQPVKYAVDGEGPTHTHGVGHAHLVCRSCHSVRCLEPVTLQPAGVPEAFVVEQADVVFKGLCQGCH